MKPVRDALQDARATVDRVLTSVDSGFDGVPRYYVSEALRSIRRRTNAAIEAASGPDPVFNTDHSMERELPVMLYWNWSKGCTGDPDTPDDPPHPEDVAVMLGENDITDLLSPEQLADVREAMLRDMEAGT